MIIKYEFKLTEKNIENKINELFQNDHNILIFDPLSHNRKMNFKNKTDFIVDNKIESHSIINNDILYISFPKKTHDEEEFKECFHKFERYVIDHSKMGEIKSVVLIDYNHFDTSVFIEYLDKNINEVVLFSDLNK